MKRMITTLMAAFAFCTLTMAEAAPITQKNDQATDTTVVAEYEDVADETVTTTTHKLSDGDGNDLFRFDTDFAEDIIIPIVAIVFGCSIPVLIVFFAFFFRYKNRKAKYRLVEQALASGQPLPPGIFKDMSEVDMRSKGIKNTFTGLGLFIFLWAITDSFGIGCIGLLIMLMGAGQWVTSLTKKDKQEPTIEEK